MPDILTLIGKSVLITIAAALAAWLYLIGFASYGEGEISTRGYVGLLLYGSLAGSFAIGLPVALLVFWMSHRHLVASPITLAMIVALSGIMMLLASFVIGDIEGMIMLGTPAFLAAVTFGVLGWLWIVAPLRKERHD